MITFPGWTIIEAICEVTSSRVGNYQKHWEKIPSEICGWATWPQNFSLKKVSNFKYLYLIIFTETKKQVNNAQFWGPLVLLEANPPQFIEFPHQWEKVYRSSCVSQFNPPYFAPFWGFAQLWNLWGTIGSHNCLLRMFGSLFRGTRCLVGLISQISN